MTQIITLNNGQEVLVEDIQSVTVNENQRIIIKVDLKSRMYIHDDLFNQIKDFFTPAQVAIFTKDIEFDVIEIDKE